MTISAKTEDVKRAFKALSRINEEVRLPVKSAWRVGRLLGKMRAIVLENELLMTKLMKDHGGEQFANNVQMVAPQRKDEETMDDFSKRVEQYRKDVSEVNKELEEADQVVVEIDCDPIPLSMFIDMPVRPGVQSGYSANDLMNANQFIKDDVGG